MSVNPGFGGQKFIDGAVEKIRRVRRAITERSLEVTIEVDGGVDTSNAARLVAAGAEILVAGTSVLGKSDRHAAIRDLRLAATSTLV
jgi:ribulose-phosphate 3-epimerase